ncbi:MAG: hypothetical protein QF767_01385 [Alphaproteobacteria bacterium]|jgi:hypothetical protein|nr:hypothetical protein [Alphaproteobacteria bacterium]
MAHTRPTSFLSTLAMIDIVMKGDHRFKAEIPLGVDAVAAYIRHRGFPVETHQCLPDEGAPGRSRSMSMASRLRCRTIPASAPWRR